MEESLRKGKAPSFCTNLHEVRFAVRHAVHLHDQGAGAVSVLRRGALVCGGMKRPYKTPIGTKLEQARKNPGTEVPRLPVLYWSERRDLNARPLPPQGSALAKLSYAPTDKLHSTVFFALSQGIVLIVARPVFCHLSYFFFLVIHSFASIVVPGL